MKNNKPTVYFDGSCPLCTREIAIFRHRSAENVDFVDVSNAAFHEMDDLTRSKAMARFHVRGGDGKLLDGAAAFITLWAELPGFRWLSSFLKVPPLIWVMDVFYDLFLRLRPSLQRLFRYWFKD